MKQQFLNSVGDLFQKLLEISGCRKAETWDQIQAHIRDYPNIPKWASDTILSLLGNMPENECSSAYGYIRRRLKKWNKIPASSWTKVKRLIIIDFLRMVSNNLRDILTPNQSKLPWISSVVEINALVTDSVSKDEHEEAKRQLEWLRNFKAHQVSLLNPDLADSLESMARATVAAAENNVQLVAVNSIKHVPVDLSNHPVGKLISRFDFAARE